jgi:hypothetical protein
VREGKKKKPRAGNWARLPGGKGRKGEKEKRAGWAGPKGEKREGGKKEEKEQILLNLNMEIEFKLKSK